MAKVIWTTHLRERLQQRGLNPDWVNRAVRFPDVIRASSTTDSHQYIKVIQGYKIVAAVKRQGSDWIVTSAWWNPAMPADRQVYCHSNLKKDKRFFLEKWVDKDLRALEKFITKR